MTFGITHIDDRGVWCIMVNIRQPVKYLENISSFCIQRKNYFRSLPFVCEEGKNLQFRGKEELFYVKKNCVKKIWHNSKLIYVKINVDVMQKVRRKYYCYRSNDVSYLQKRKCCTNIIVKMKHNNTYKYTDKDFISSRSPI